MKLKLDPLVLSFPYLKHCKLFEPDSAKMTPAQCRALKGIFLLNQTPVIKFYPLMREIKLFSIIKNQLWPSHKFNNEFLMSLQVLK